MKKQLLFVCLCILMVLFSLAGCVSQNKTPQSPEELIETFVTASCAKDYKTYYSCMGAVMLDEYAEHIDTQPQQEGLAVTVYNIKLEKLIGEDYNEALEGITKYWLNNEDYAGIIEFTYSAFDIKQIGHASCVVKTEEVQEEYEIEQLCVIETDKGWFIAMDGI